MILITILIQTMDRDVSVAGSTDLGILFVLDKIRHSVADRSVV